MARKLGIALVLLVALALGVAGYFIGKHRAGVADATEAWESHRPAPLGDIGTTSSLAILPLVDWHASREDLQTNMGVSYLVRTDDQTILFDTGNNSEDAAVSPLEHNMEALGVDLAEIDTVVISHAHFDHIGGRKWSNGDVSGTTFGIGNKQPDLSGKRVIAPIEMTYPGITPEVGTDPKIIGPGVATTGTIPRKLFVGWIDEQALAVHVEGRGLVLIVGCGHQTLTRLIERTERVFDAPIYGVVGGLHFPVPEGRTNLAGINLQRRLASGTGPLAPLTEEDVDRELSLLEDRQIGLLGIGGHDSSNEVIANASIRFEDAFVRVGVGEVIELRAPESASEGMRDESALRAPSR